MEACTIKNLKKKSREGKAKSHNAGMSKKKKKKEPKMKLSNYEKTVRKFNLNQRLCAQSKAENRRITRGPLKIKPSRDGMFLKAKRSSFVQKKTLNDANEARKNEDINKIIDIGNEIYKNGLDTSITNEEKDILKFLNVPEIYAGEKKSRGKDKLNLTESDVLCSQNHDDPGDGTRRYRNRRQKEAVLACTTSSSSSSSNPKSEESSKTRRGFGLNGIKPITRSESTNSIPENVSGHRIKSVSSFSNQSEDYHFKRAINSESGIYDELIKTGTSDGTSVTFPCTSSRASKLRQSKSEKLRVGLEDFEEFIVKFENALARDECPKMNVPGIAETVLQSLKMLYRRRIKIYEDRKMRKGAHHVQENERKSKKTNDPMLTWFFDGASRNKNEDSPRIAPGMGAWNAKSDSNIFTFPYPGRREEKRESSIFPDFIQPIGIFQDRSEVHLQNLFPGTEPFSSEEWKRNIIISEVWKKNQASFD